MVDLATEKGRMGSWPGFMLVLAIIHWPKIFLLRGCTFHIYMSEQ